MARVNAIIDEAASLGPNMGCIEDAIDKLRGYGLFLQLYYQSPAQLKKCFPGEQDQTVMANMTQVFFAVNDSSAEYVSNRLGDQTIVVESWGESSGYSTQSSSGSPGTSTRSSNSNTNFNQVARKLLKPEEVWSLNERIAIAFVPGQRPIWTCLERYYENPGKASQIQPGKILAGAILFMLMGTFCLLATLNLREQSNHVERQRIERRRSRDLGRTQATGDTGANGTGKRLVQRQRVRPVWPGTIHTGHEPRKLEQGTGTTAGE